MKNYYEEQNAEEYQSTINSIGKKLRVVRNNVAFSKSRYSNSHCVIRKKTGEVLISQKISDMVKGNTLDIGYHEGHELESRISEDAVTIAIFCKNCGIDIAKIELPDNKPHLIPVKLEKSESGRVKKKSANKKHVSKRKVKDPDNYCKGCNDGTGCRRMCGLYPDLNIQKHKKFDMEQEAKLISAGMCDELHED